MIADDRQLEGALRQIAWAADALEGVRRDVNADNALLFPITAESFLAQIRTLTAEVRQYVRPATAGAVTVEPPRAAPDPVAA